MVGNDQCVRAAFRCFFRIFRFHNAFDNQLAAPQIFNARDVVPAQARVELFGSPRRQRRQIADIFSVSDDIAERAAFRVQHFHAPFGLGRQID